MNHNNNFVALFLYGVLLIFVFGVSLDSLIKIVLFKDRFEGYESSDSYFCNYTDLTLDCPLNVEIEIEIKTNSNFDECDHLIDNPKSYSECYFQNYTDF